jgi:squalene-associated FAD-dependent desaturase
VSRSAGSGVTAAGPDVVVVGGGLAGLAAALACTDAGARVTVLERRPRLGGLTWSFEQRGRWVDNGQHVFLRCCHAYLGFLRRIGSDGDVHVQPRLDVTVLEPGRPPARLRRTRLPAPLHMAPALLGYRHLGMADRLRLGRAAWELRTADLDDPALDAQTFAAWLAGRGQSQAAVDALWDLITVPTVNLPAAEASAAMGAKVFQTGLLTDSGGADIGWSGVPLGLLHGERAAAALRRAGADVHTGERVAAVEEGKGPSAGRLVVRTESRQLVAGAVVTAVPHHVVNHLLPAGVVPGQAALERLGASPIVDVHVVYDRPVTDLALAAGLGTPAQWVFDRTASSGLAAAGHGGQYLAVSISAADAWVGRHPTDIVAAMLPELERMFPRAASATVTDTLVTKERLATFRATPGTASLRPGPATALAGLAVAGSWTATGWPATMEGAVRSGIAAAAAAMGSATAAGRPSPAPGAHPTPQYPHAQPLPEEVA